MLRTLKIVLAMLLMTLGAATYADPPGRVARLNQVSGVVSFASAEAPDDWTQAVLNRPLTGGDRLWADSTGRAELHMGSTAIRLNALTNVDILNLDDQTLQLRLAQGSINLRVRDLAPGETLEIATPSGAVLVRQPGSYRVSTDPQDGTARVLVNFGQAEVVTPGQNVTVPSGQVAVVSPQSGIAFEVAAYASADEFDRWSADRDRREDRISSTRYVSRDMTGYEDLDQYGGWRTLPEYGAVWVPTRVTPGWAPYRYGHWSWISPWGWTWVDDAPWGFAPFHYGRWVHTGGYWAWAPGAIARRPVYAPALVAFVGGSNLSVSVSSGPAVGWFPLGYREPFIPWYRASPTHVRNVNVTNVTNVTNITTNVTNIRYANRNNPQAVTVVPQQAFVSARPVAQASVSVAQADLARAEVGHARPPAEPVRASFASERASSRPPQQAIAREVVTTTAPPRPAAQSSFAAQDSGASAERRGDHEPRVRVIGRERFEARAAERSQPQPVQAVPAVQAPAAAGTPPQTGVTRAPETTPAQARPRPPSEERRAVERATVSATATTPAIAAPRPEIAREMPAPRTERSAVRPDERGPVSRPEPRQPQPDARPAVAPSEARPAPRIEERRGPRAEHRPAPSPEAGPVSRPDPRPAIQAEGRPAPRPEASRPIPPAAPPAARTEERRAPVPAEPPKARPAPPPGQGATRAAAPPHEVRFSERPAAAPRAAQPPQQRPAEAPRAPAPQPHEARRTHPAQP